MDSQSSVLVGIHARAQCEWVFVHEHSARERLYKKTYLHRRNMLTPLLTPSGSVARRGGKKDCR